jgi:hypothetical protein
MAIELADNATHEDVQAAVDSIIEDRKGDAQLIAEERDKPVGDMSAEEDTGSDDTTSDGDDTGDKIEWLDDDLKAEIAAHGIDETELAEFTSREEVERAMRFLDKSAIEAGRKALVKEEPDKEPEKKEGRYEISLDKEIYDDGLVDELSRMRDHYESRLEALESRIAQVDATALEQEFDTHIDAIGFPELFGKTGKESPKELKRREDVMVDCLAHREGMKLMGRTVEIDQSLVLRTARARHAEEFSKKELKAKTRKIASQSDRRLGGGATRPSEPAETLRDEARRLYKELENAG